jgi:type I restriction enzyme, R subunit
MAFNENTRVKIPAILHLCRLGYQYRSLVNAKIDGSTNIFTDIFDESILRINPDMDQSEVGRVLEDLSLVLDFEDLGQAFYNKLTATSGIRLIDFKNFENNSFHVVTELTCKNGDEEFRPDKQIVLAENQQLASLRDWLLPMLMNGQVTVGSSVKGKKPALK